MSNFLKLFGETDKSRVLDFFIENKVFCYTIQELSEGICISEEKVEKIVEYFVEIGVLKIKNANFLELTNNEIVLKLFLMENHLNEICADIEINKQKAEDGVDVNE